MVEEGKIPSSAARILEGEAIPASRGHETMIFEAFFDVGLGFLAMPLLERVLHHFYVELSKISTNAIACLAIFEWFMRAEGCEGRAELAEDPDGRRRYKDTPLW